MEDHGTHTKTESALYRDLGELARYINLAHQKFADGIQDESNIKVKAKDLPTAHEMLLTVTEETEEATLKVMNYSDETSDAIGEMRTMLEEMEAAVPAANPARAKVSDTVERMRAKMDAVEGVQMNTVMALSFQDLTGQKIKQVIALMADVEERILKLVVQFGTDSADHATESAEAKLQAVKDGDDPTTLRQDSVDDLLAGFGF